MTIATSVHNDIKGSILSLLIPEDCVEISSADFKSLYEGYGDLDPDVEEVFNVLDTLSDEDQKEYKKTLARSDPDLYRRYLAQKRSIDDLETPPDIPGIDRPDEKDIEKAKRQHKKAVDAQDREAPANTRIIPHFDPNYQLRFREPEEGEPAEAPLRDHFRTFQEYKKAETEYLESLAKRAIPPDSRDFGGDMEKFHEEELKHNAAVKALFHPHLEPQQWMRKLKSGVTGAWNKDQFILDRNWQPEYIYYDVPLADGTVLTQKRIANLETEDDYKKFNGYLYRKGVDFALDPYAVKKLARLTNTGDSAYQQSLSQSRGTNLDDAAARMIAQRVASQIDRTKNVSDMPLRPDETDSDRAERIFNAPKDTAGANRSSKELPSWERGRKSVFRGLKDVDPHEGEGTREFAEWLFSQIDQGKYSQSVGDLVLAFIRAKGADDYLPDDLRNKALQLFGDYQPKDELSKSRMPTGDFVKMIPRRDKAGNIIKNASGQPDYITARMLGPNEPLMRELTQATETYKRLNAAGKIEKPEKPSPYARKVNIKGAAPGQWIDPMKMSDNEQLPMDDENFMPPPIATLNARASAIRTDIAKLQSVLKRWQDEVQYLMMHMSDKENNPADLRKKQILGLSGRPAPVLADPTNYPRLIALVSGAKAKIKKLEDMLRDTEAKKKFAIDKGWATDKTYAQVPPSKIDGPVSPKTPANFWDWKRDDTFIPATRRHPKGILSKDKETGEEYIRIKSAEELGKDFDAYYKKATGRPVDTSDEELMRIRDEYIQSSLGDENE